MFSHKILIIGYGSVAKCTLPLLFQHVNVAHSQVTVMDFVDQREALMSWIERGVNYVQESITPDNMHQVLAQHVSSGGLIIDLAWNIDTLAMLNWCHENAVLYINTSVEEWDPSENIHQKPLIEKTLYWRQMKIREAIAAWGSSTTTAVVDHGANPGLISHFTKQGLLDIAQQCLTDNKIPAKNIETALSEENFAHLAMHLGVKVIHCSEQDTQVTSRPKVLNEFVSTWSVPGLFEEGLAPAELGWGTHENKLPQWGHCPSNGPKNQIFLAQMGMNTWVRSWVPSQEILGMLIRHGEAFGISDALTVWENNEAIYRPTVHYAYMPSNEAISSLHELRARNYQMQDNQRIMSDDVTQGQDILGALIMGHPYTSWWTGSILSIEESRQLVPNQNATTTQVAIGVVAAIVWMIENPQRGFCLPDDLPHEMILKIAKPYLGEFVSKPSDWSPQKNYQPYFKENDESFLDDENLWSFDNFLFK